MTDVQPRFKAPKTKVKLSQYRKVRKWVISRSGGRCEARFSTECSGRAVHAHHIVPRSRGRDDSVGNLLAVCHECHTAIHAHPQIARGYGLLQHRDP